MFDDKHNLNTKEKLYTFLFEMLPKVAVDNAYFFSNLYDIKQKKKENLDIQVQNLDIETKKIDIDCDDDGTWEDPWGNVFGEETKIY